MQRHLLSTFIYIKGPLEYKKYSKCKAGMFGVFALDLKAIYFIVLEDLISHYELVIIQPLKLQVNFKRIMVDFLFYIKNWYLKVADNF